MKGRNADEMSSVLDQLSLQDLRPTNPPSSESSLSNADDGGPSQVRATLLSETTRSPSNKASVQFRDQSLKIGNGEAVDLTLVVAPSTICCGH